MEALMQITTNDKGISVVSGKVLHGFLEIKTRFDQWIKRMLEYGFQEGADYQCLIKFDQTPTGGKRGIIDDYALTLDTAKHISMIQRTEKGMQARQYFIECEKQLTKVKEAVKPAIQDLQRQLFLKDQEIAHLNKLIDLKDGRIKDAREMIEIHRIQGDKWYQYQQDTQSMATYYRDLYRQETEISKVLREKVMSLDAAKSTPSTNEPHAQVELPGISTGTRINRLVRQYATDHSGKISFEETWNWLYREFRDRYHVDPLRFTLKKNETRIGKINEMGMIEQLLAVAEHLLLPVQVAA